MGPSGYPFPPTCPTSDLKLQDGLLAIQKESLCTPSCFSPGVYRDPGSVAPTPGHGRDSTLLPSIMSPPVLPGATGIPGNSHLSSPSEPAHSVSSISNMQSVRQLGLSTAFAEAIPSGASLPTPPQERGLKLRLPSFHKLGIANAHPDSIAVDGEGVLVGTLSDPAGFVSDSGDSPFFDTSIFGPSAPSEEMSNVGSGKIQGPLSAATQLAPHLAVLTPPEERPIFDWSSSEFPTPAMESVPSGSDAPAVDPATQPIVAPIGIGAGPTPEDSEGEEMEKWLDDAIDQISSSIDPSNFPGRSMRVLSHALPSPSIPGHSFPHIIEQIRDRVPASSLMFINLLHAVPGRFNLSDLPTSPPTTPGQPLGSSNGTGEDYFTAKVFEAAVTAVDYSSPQRVIPATAFAPSNTSHATQHFPLAAPSSLNFSIVERFVPPTSRNEGANLFTITKPSLLVDRLVELSPGNGCLIFIYPTRKGAETFCTKYLAPILDPVLRAMVVVNNFSADLSGAIGRMSAVSEMYEFETLHRKVSELCETLQQGSVSNPQVRQRLHGDSGNFSLVYSAKKHVILERKVWTNWIIKQEKTRVRNTVDLHFRYANRYMADSDTTPTHLIEEIFNGVASRAYPAGQEPTGEDSKIEMGVFVIKRGR